MNASATKTSSASATYHLMVVTKHQNIKAYFNNKSPPSIDVNDATYSSAYVGIKVFYLG